MLQTSSQPKKCRSLLTNAIAPDLSGNRIRQHSSYPSIPAKYSGLPNFLNYCIGPGAALEGADLSNADLRWSNFRSANLKTAKLNGSVFWGAILTNANLVDADLSHADFTGVDLVGADLSGADVEGTCFLGARYNQTSRFPEEFGNPEKKGMVSLNESMQLS